MNRLFWLLLALAAVLSGCKKTEPPKTETPQPSPSAAAPAAAPDPGVAATPTADVAPTAAPTTPTEGAPADAPPKPELDAESAEVEALLRKFIELLAAQKSPEAYALMIDAESCVSVMKDTTTCDQILLGQAEGKKELEADPVPFNSQIIEIFVGQKQEMGEDKGAKVPSAIWVGNVIRARSPEGTEFMMKSLGVLKTGKGLRILWGKRRSGPDSPRSVKPVPSAAPEAPAAPANAPGTQGATTTTPPSPTAPAQPTASGQPTLPDPATKPTP